MKRAIPLLLLLFSIAAGTASAQFLTLKAGAGFSSHYTDARLIGAYKIGLGYEYDLTGRLTIEPSLNFSAKGWKAPDQTVYVRDAAGNVMTHELTGEPLTGVMSVSSTAYYVQLPILLGYYLPTSRTSYIKLGAGPYAAYGVAGKMTVKGDTERSGADMYYYSEKTFDEPGTHRFDAGLVLFAGYEFNRNFNCGLEADLGLTKFNATSRNVSLMLSFTYRFRPAAPAPVAF